MNKTKTGVGGCILMLITGCTVGPPYHRPDVMAAPAYKEVSGQDAGSGWKLAQPQDAALRGNWWELFDDPKLNELEQQAAAANQTIAGAFASFMQARALVREARAQYFPTLTVGASVTRSRQPVPAGAGGAGGAVQSNDFSLPFDASWTPDLWGRVRNLVKGQVAAAQASAADLVNTRLTAQAELAVDYFQLRGQDALIQLSTATVETYRQSLAYTRAQFETGIGTDEAVAQAEVQVRTAQAQATNLGIARAQYEHAIALLVGQPASIFTLPPEQPFNVKVPQVPVAVPSELLERRPDVAADERLVAQANAQIGVAQAAYFPTLTLSASAGFQSSTLADWLKWPSRVWSLGPSVSETLFDGGLRGATVAQYRAAEDQAAATYRQTVLTAFQQVEDNLSGLRVLMQEIREQEDAVSASQRYVNIATDRYKLGLDPYLNVMTAQASLLGNQQSAITLRMQQLNDCVQLIEALGGGWSSSQLPTSHDIGVGHAEHPVATPPGP
jgi:NodT family efflux transporter outer membrane factor (OMF) lipoprotein